MFPKFNHCCFCTFSELKNHVGQKMGWGIHYDPRQRDQPGFDDKAEQLVLCYVSVDLQIVFARMLLQPAGGWYPTVYLNNGGGCHYWLT